MEQGSEEWLKARLGKATASRVSDVVAKTRTGQPGASRGAYMGELIAERLTGIPTEKYTNAAMQWGIETEAEARAAYQFDRGLIVERVGFLDHPMIPMAGASPDGLIGEDGLIEIKCPTIATHIDTLLGQSVPGKYLLQMQFQMAVTGRGWCDFVSYDPRMPEEMRLWVQRVSRDDKQIDALEAAVCEFLEELAEKVKALTDRYNIKEAA